MDSNTERATYIYYNSATVMLPHDKRGTLHKQMNYSFTQSLESLLSR